MPVQVCWIPLEPSEEISNKLKIALEQAANRAKGCYPRIINQEAYLRGLKVMYQIMRQHDDSFTFSKLIRTTYNQALSDLGSTGFRYPNFDEWEYLCGAGASTLFRWGNRFLPNPPYDVQTLDHHWRELWQASGGLLEYHGFGDGQGNPKHAPNAFGLIIADRDYRFELISDRVGAIRGGDGGSHSSAGAGLIPTQVTMASAYFHPSESQQDPAATISQNHALGRRVLPLK